jgi:5-phospho-D-xylono-1,4-lactonase
LKKCIKKEVIEVSGNYIQSTSGLIPISEIRYTHSHEHLFTYATPTIAAEKPEMVLDSVDKIGEDINLFKAAGGNTIIEMTTIDYGRDVVKLNEIVLKYNINIVAAAGFNKGTFNKEFLEKKSIDEVTVQLIDELQNGIGDTGIKPGVLKIGTSMNVIEPWEEIGLRAIARAHLKTGVPISTHTQAGTMAEEQLNLFSAEGVPAENIVLCHLDQNPDYELHRRLVERGAYLCYDSIPKPQYKTEQRSIEFIAELAKNELHTNIIVGGDFSRKTYYKGYGGKIGLDYILTVFKPKLLSYLENKGLESNRIVEDIFKENPKRAFAIREV